VKNDVARFCGPRCTIEFFNFHAPAAIARLTEVTGVNGRRTGSGEQVLQATARQRSILFFSRRKRCA